MLLWTLRQPLKSCEHWVSTWLCSLEMYLFLKSIINKYVWSWNQQANCKVRYLYHASQYMYVIVGTVRIVTCIKNPNDPKSIIIHPLVLCDFDYTQYSPSNRACSPCVPNPSNSTGCFCWIQDFSQAMDALHLLLYQFHPSPTIGVRFYCMLMAFWGFGMVSSKNAQGVRVLKWMILLV